MCIQVNNKILSEIELQNQLFEIETINIPDCATNQRSQDTTIIITSRPNQVLYYTMPMPYYKKTNLHYMIKRYH